MTNAVETLLVRLQAWWRRQNELGSLDAKELERIGAELGMSTSALEDLAARGPHAARLLYERMQALGMSRGELEHAAQGFLRDLQRTCACCNQKGVCERDLVEQPDDPAWKSYCPNATTLEALALLKRKAALDG